MRHTTEQATSGAFILCTTFAHPLEDAVEGSYTFYLYYWSLKTTDLLYDWVVNEIDMENKPRQIEFAKLYLTNVVTGKRYIKKLVEDGIVDGWDDPRLVSIAALKKAWIYTGVNKNVY